MNLKQARKKELDFKLSDYSDLIETVAKVEFKKLATTHVIDFLEVVNIGSQTIHSLSRLPEFKYYNSSYLATAIKWAIRNEVRRRYKWYSTKQTAKKTTSHDGNELAPENLKESLYSTIMSIDELINDELAPQIKDSNHTPDEYAEFIELKKTLREAITILPAREKELIEAKFFKEMKLSELTAEFGISASRITRIIQSGLAKLKVELENRNLEK